MLLVLGVQSSQLLSKALGLIVQKKTLEGDVSMGLLNFFSGKEEKKQVKKVKEEYSDGDKNKVVSITERDWNTLLGIVAKVAGAADDAAGWELDKERKILNGMKQGVVVKEDNEDGEE